MNANVSTSISQTHGWTIKRIRNITEAKFSKWPCWYQVKTALTIWRERCCWLCTHRCRQDPLLLDTPPNGSGRWKGQDELCGYATQLVRKAKCEGSQRSWLACCCSQQGNCKSQAIQETSTVKCCDSLWHNTFWGNGTWLLKSPNPKFASHSIIGHGSSGTERDMWWDHVGQGHTVWHHRQEPGSMCVCI